MTSAIHAGIAHLVFIVMSETFRKEREQHRLVFTCEDCLHFCGAREECAVRYPTEPHRDALIDGLVDGERLYFCKMFEPA